MAPRTRASSKRKGFETVENHAEESQNGTDLKLTKIIIKASEPPHSRLFVCLSSVYRCEKPLGQFLIRHGSEATIIYKNCPNSRKEEKATIVTSVVGLFRRTIEWSPLGTYFVQISKDVVALYIGKDYLAPFLNFGHPMVEHVEFSPNEKFLVTYNNKPLANGGFWFKMFDMTTGKIALGLETHATITPVTIRWAGGKDDKYFAILHKNTASVYETTTGDFSMLGQKHNDVLDLSWSPTESILVLLKPTKVVLVQIPSEKVLMEKNIILSVSKMYWQSNGKYLAVQVDQKDTSLLELFFFSKKCITNMDLKVEKKILALSWEPKGDRFAVIHGHRSQRRVSFYAMESGRATLQFFYQNSKVNSLFWSPTGNHVVIAALKRGSFGKAHLELLDADKNTSTIMEHRHANNIAWDPTGSYVATSVTISENVSEEGSYRTDDFKMWSSAGNLLYSWISPDYRLLQWSWRPYGGTRR